MPERSNQPPTAPVQQLKVIILQLQDVNVHICMYKHKMSEETLMLILYVFAHFKRLQIFIVHWNMFRIYYGKYSTKLKKSRINHKYTVFIQKQHESEYQIHGIPFKPHQSEGRSKFFPDSRTSKKTSLNNVANHLEYLSWDGRELRAAPCKTNTPPACVFKQMPALPKALSI